MRPSYIYLLIANIFLVASFFMEETNKFYSMIFLACLWILYSIISQFYEKDENNLKNKIEQLRFEIILNALEGKRRKK